MPIERLKKLIVALPRQKLEEAILALGSLGYISFAEQEPDIFFGLRKLDEKKLAEIRVLRSRAEAALNRLGLKRQDLSSPERLLDINEISKSLTLVEEELGVLDRWRVSRVAAEFLDILRTLGLEWQEVKKSEMFVTLVGFSRENLVEEVRRRAVQTVRSDSCEAVVGLRTLRVRGSGVEEVPLPAIVLFGAGRGPNVPTVVIVERSEARELLEWLKTLGFQSREDLVKYLDSPIRVRDEEISATEEMIRKQLSEIFPSIEFAEALYKYQSLAYVSDSIAAMVAWFPASKEREVRAVLAEIERMGGKCYILEPGPHEEPPILLRNKWPFRLFESLTRQYGYPSPHEIDPTGIISILWLAMFGFMFPDLGQGAVLVILGYLFKSHPKWVRKNLGMSPRVGIFLMAAGIMAMISGLLTGEVFLLEGIIHPLLPGLPPGWAKSSYYIKWALKLAVFFGLLQLTLAYVLAIRIMAKEGEIKEAILGGRGLAGLMMLWGVVGLGFTFIGIRVVPRTPWFGPVDIPTVGLGDLKGAVDQHGVLGLFMVPYAYLTVPLLLLIISSVMVVAHSKMEGDIMGGVAELIEGLLGSLSNSISYARLAVFAIAHAMLAVIVEQLFETAGGAGAWGVFVFLNIFCILLEALVVMIQATRLVFYEFMSKFYEGRGRGFRPTTIPHMKLLKRAPSATIVR